MESNNQWDEVSPYVHCSLYSKIGDGLNFCDLSKFVEG